MRNKLLNLLFCLLLPTALLSESRFDNDEHTILYHSLSPDDSFTMQDPSQPRQFETGPTPDSEALCLKPTESAKAGLFFHVDTTQLEEGTVEVWINPHEDVGPESPRTILNLGSAGNTKWRITMRASRVEAIFATKETPKIKWRSGPIEPGIWHHIALVWSPRSGVKFFVDGVCVGEDKRPLTLWQLTKKEALYVGASPQVPEADDEGKPASSSHYVGCISGLRFSDIAREDFPKPQEH